MKVISKLVASPGLADVGGIPSKIFKLKALELQLKVDDTAKVSRVLGHQIVILLIY